MLHHNALQSASMNVTATSTGHAVHCSIAALRTRPFRNYRTGKVRADQKKPCACRAQPSERSGTITGLLLLPALLRQPAAFAEELKEQAKQAVEQGQQVAEQAQQQFSLPSDLQYPSSAASKLPSSLPSSSAVEDYFSQNPGVIAAGVAVVAIGLLLARLIGTGVTAKKVSAAKAFDLLSRKPNTLFIDIRSKKEANETGSPDLRSIKKKVVSIPYTTGLAGDLVEGFPDKLLKLPGLSEDSEIVFFDSFGQDAKAVAGAVREGVKQVYWIADGAEGPRGWKASQLPWREPFKGLNLNLPNLPSLKGVNLDKLADDLKSKPTLTKAGLAVGAIAAAGVLLFNEAEVVLELLGVAAVGNFLAKRVLFAKDRDQTVEQFRDIVDNKIAAGEVGKDLRKVTDTLVDTVSDTERRVESRASPKVKSAASSVKSASQDAKQTAGKTSSKAQSQAQSVADKSKDAGKDLQSRAKSVSKSADKAFDRTADKAQSQAQNLTSKGKQAGQEVKQQASSAGRDAQQTADKAGSQAQGTAQQAKPQAGGAGSSTQQQFQKQKDEVVGDTKDNIKEAEDTLKSKADSAGSSTKQQFQKQKNEVVGDTKDNIKEAEDALKTKDFQKQKDEVIGESEENIKEAENTLKQKAGSNGSSTGPEVPSQEDVKQQAQEARGWIEAWRKKQPVKSKA